MRNFGKDPVYVDLDLCPAQLLKEATESRHKCELMKEQESQLKQQVGKRHSATSGPL